MQQSSHRWDNLPTQIDEEPEESWQFVSCHGSDETVLEPLPERMFIGQDWRVSRTVLSVV